LFLFAVAGLVCTAIGSPAARAVPNVQPGRFLPAGTATATYTCMGADADTQALLDAVGLSTFSVPASITSAAVDPSPSPGEDFQMAFTWTFTLPANLAGIAVSLGVSQLNITNSVDPMNAVSGVTGDVVGHGSPVSVLLGDGTHDVSYSEGPFTGTVHRTAAVDEPIVFAPGNVTNTSTPAELGLPLNIACTPGSVVNLSVVDQDGVAPSTTSTSTTTTLRTTTTTGIGATTTVATGGELAVTGGIDLRLVVLALALIDIGYLTWSAGQPRRRRMSGKT
jgi:hypothetical protein